MKRYDTDGSGFLSLSEFRAALANLNFETMTLMLFLRHMMPMAMVNCATVNLRICC